MSLSVTTFRDFISAPVITVICQKLIAEGCSGPKLFIRDCDGGIHGFQNCCVKGMWGQVLNCLQ